MCNACKETRYVHHQHDEDRDYAHEADMAALRREQLAADIGADEIGKCADCGTAIWPDGTCCCDDQSDEGPDVYGYDNHDYDEEEC